LTKKIFISRPLPQEVLNTVAHLGEITVRENTSAMSESEMVYSLANYDIVLPTLGDIYSEEIFKSCSKITVKLLANFGVGFNHIDVKAANDHGVKVSNTPGAVTDATADIAMALMLMCCRRTSEGERIVRSNKWEGWHPTQMLGFHISNKKVGIVGMGNIGQAIAQRCHFGFGMQVGYFSRSPKKLDYPVDRYESLTELASNSDVLIVSVPGGSATHHLINKDIFSSMQPHAYFVNIARGDVVKETDLIEALKLNQIAGAGLDVYEFEPRVPKELIAMENVVLLPHLGTASLEVRTGMGLMAVENIKFFLAGNEPPNLV
jgi:lactate dehydrogenase-like 2-hydroxyacid dehydrogenase